ncbi:MAG: CoA transferase [Pigmentiphaga sp.]|uniref:CoA transferase n=1 Tax=Pigmentiphaga sp. TaxID=1977564 RepID=UPI0029A02463|nr:CoA transferase [Pigmentiphaga sp.]MDX3905586.1 CoA transferase [Pigmentiphaga sp.]
MSLLRNIKIVEFAQGIAGPLAALRLADLGADVIKCEDIQGDWLRGAAPLIPGTTMSAAFFELNRGKRSMQLDSDPHAAGATLRQLLREADVFITDRPQKELAAFGLSAGEDTDASPCPENTGLITVEISGWGHRGPLRDRPGSELTAQAMAGYTRYLGEFGKPACRLGADVASAGTGIFACQAVLAALFARARERCGGQRVSLSLLNSLISLKSIHLAAQSDPDSYAGPRVGGANYPPERGWKTRDNPIFFAFGGSVGAQGRPGWVNFIEEAGFTRLLEDPRFDKIGRSTTGYGIRVPETRGEYEKEFARYSANELVDLIRKHAGNAASYMRADETIAHPQTQALKVVREVPMSGHTPVRVRAFPARFSRTAAHTPGDAPPLGRDTAAIEAALNASPGKWPGRH